MMKLRHQLRGAHVHVQVFSGPHTDATMAKVGDLVFAAGAEWNDFREMMLRDTVTFEQVDPPPQLPACRKCGRAVKSPCHDAEGYHTGGPWDSFCRDYFYGSE